MPRRPRTSFVVVVLGTSLLVTGVMRASAAPGTSSTPIRNQSSVEHSVRKNAVAAAADDPQEFGPGGLPRSSIADFTLGVGLAPSLRSDRAKVNVDLAPIEAVAYLNPKTRLPQDGFEKAPRIWLPQRPNPSCDYYIANFGADIYIVDIDQPDPDKPGTIRSVGNFPDTKVSTLAFGTIPLTATLHVNQVARDGKVQPLLADNTGDNDDPGRSVAKGAAKDAARGCDPDWEKYVSRSAVITGEATARFSDVRLDGALIDVGSNCHTATPLQLHLNGLRAEDGGNYRLTDKGTLIQAADPRVKNPSNPIAVAPGARNLTIPAFTGCIGKSGEDYSGLVTNTVSGSEAALAVNQSIAAANFFDPFDNVTKSGVTIPPYVAPPVPGK